MQRPGQKTIEGMSHADLTKFVHNLLATQNPDKGASYDQVDVHGVLNVKDKLNLSPQAKANLLSDYVTQAALATDLAPYLTSAAAAATYVAQSADAGKEIGYDPITVGVNVATAETTIIAGSAYTFDGSPVMLEFFCPDAALPSVAAATVSVDLFDGATQLNILSVLTNEAAVAIRNPVHLCYRFTPTAGVHTYAIKARASSITGTPAMQAGTGAISSGLPPAFLRITKV